MTPVPIHTRLGLLDALARPDEFRATVTLRNSSAMIDIANRARMENAENAAQQVRATEQLGAGMADLANAQMAAAAGMARAQMAASGMVAASVERLRADVQAATDTLDAIQGEIEHTRRLQEEQLAVQHEALDLQRRSLALQQGMLQSDLLQAKLEEFLYQFKKAVERYSVDDPEYPATTRLLMLRGFLGEIAQHNIATPMIRGIDKKALLDDFVAKAQRLVRELAAHPDVLAAIEWVRREQQRVKELEERVREDEARLEERRVILQTEEKELRHQVEETDKVVAAQEKNVKTSFQYWFYQRFGFQVDSLIAVSLLLSLLSCCGAPFATRIIDRDPAKQHDVDATAYGAGKVIGSMCCFSVPVWLLFGAIYLIFSLLHKVAVGDIAKHQEELNRTVNAEALAEIARLKEKASQLRNRRAQVLTELGQINSRS